MINARRSIKLKAQLVSPNPISRINQFPPISKNNNKKFSSSFDILTHTKNGSDDQSPRSRTNFEIYSCLSPPTNFVRELYSSLISKNLKGKFSNVQKKEHGARERISRKRRIEFSCPFSLSVKTFQPYRCVCVSFLTHEQNKKKKERNE